MKRYELDGRLCLDREDFCRRLIDLLNLPEYCGKNLDALYDALTSLPEATELTVTHFDSLEGRLGDWGRRLRKMLLDASEGGEMWVNLPREDPPDPAVCRSAGKALQEELILRYSPIALKLLRREEDIPAGTVRPWRDEGNRLAMCQAFALVRRNRKAYTLLKEDHWCVWPLVGDGMVELDDEDVTYMGSKLFFAEPEKHLQFSAGVCQAK